VVWDRRFDLREKRNSEVRSLSREREGDFVSPHDRGRRTVLKPGRCLRKISAKEEEAAWG